MSRSTTEDLRVLTTHDVREWDAVLGRCAHDFYHTPGYHRFSERRGGAKARLFVHTDGEHVIALPLLLRRIEGTDWHDATSVYGYAGPAASRGKLPETLVKDFRAALQETLGSLDVVSVFSRLHPLLPGQLPLLDGLGWYCPGGRTVSVDLTLPLEEQWSGFRKSQRRGVRRLRTQGLETVHDAGFRYLDEFIDIYRESMDRVNAGSAYYFDRSYFKELVEALGDGAVLLVLKKGSRVLAGGLYVECDGIFQAHLGGMRNDAIPLGPTRLLDDDARLFAVERGLHTFHLGGGVGSEEDSLFHYKAGFSDRRHDFHTWRWIVEPGIYRELCESNSPGAASDPDGFFPAYRSPSQPPQ